MKYYSGPFWNYSVIYVIFLVFILVDMWILLKKTIFFKIDILLNQLFPYRLMPNTLSTRAAINIYSTRFSIAYGSESVLINFKTKHKNNKINVQTEKLLIYKKKQLTNTATWVSEKMQLRRASYFEAANAKN